VENLTQLPPNLVAPHDDGQASHLLAMHLPSLQLLSTDNLQIDLSKIPGKLIVYVYPMTGRPDMALPDGWDAIPGARGCTPQSCSFRDHYSELLALNTKVFGLSVQATEYQLEAKQRLHLPFELLSDSSLQLKATLGLPTFEVADMELYKRITLIVQDSVIVKVFYPVFPPDRNADDVLSWLKSH